MPGNDPAELLRPCGGIPGSEGSLGEILVHRLFQFGFCQKLFEPGVLLLQLRQLPVLLGLHAAILQPPAVVGRLHRLDDVLALDGQLFAGLELADDLLCFVPGALHSQVLGLVWPDEVS